MSLKGRLRSLEEKTRIKKPGPALPDLPPSVPMAPQTKAELQAFVRHLTGFTVPDRAVCSGHAAPLDALADAYFALSPVSLWLGSRGLAGKSTLLALLCFAENVGLGAQCTILGGSEQQSRRVQEVQYEVWSYENAPRHLLLTDPSATRIMLSGGAWSRALTASTKSARGLHPQRLRGDEVDEMDLAVLLAALGQPMAARGIKDQTVLSSTHHYADGTFSECLRMAAEKGWSVYRWCYRESMAPPNGWLEQSQVETKRATVPALMWETEYELQEPNPESRAILPEAVEKAFSADLGSYSAAAGQPIILEQPIPGAKYATGGDWAKEQDFTDIPTIRTDVHPCRLVAYQRVRRLPWPQMVRLYDERVRKYPGRAGHDGTGLGNVVADLMTVQAESIVLVGRKRSDIFSEWIAALERGEYRGPRIDTQYREHKFASRDAIYGSGHPPDSFVSLAIAWHVGMRKSGWSFNYE